MARTLQIGLKEFQSSGRAATIATWIDLTLPEYLGNALLPAANRTYHICTSSRKSDSTITANGLIINDTFYSTNLKGAGDITRSVTSATERLSVAIQNLTTEFGALLLKDVNVLQGASVIVGRWWRDELSGVEYAQQVFTGIVDGAGADERAVTLEVLSDLYAARAIGGRAVTPTCDVIYNSALIALHSPLLGEACGATDKGISCNKLLNDAGGCSGHANEFRFAGFVNIEGVSTVAGPSGLAIPPRNQLLGNRDEYFPMRGIVSLANAFAVDDPTNGITNLNVGLMFAQTSGVAVANTTSETTLLHSATGTKIIPANTVQVGTTFEFHIAGKGAKVSGTTRWRLKLGSVTLVDTGSIAWAPTGTREWIFRGKFTVYAIGASGSIIGQGEWQTFDTATTFMVSEGLMSAGATIDFTADQTFDFLGTHSIANSGNTLTCTNAIIQRQM